MHSMQNAKCSISAKRLHSTQSMHYIDSCDSTDSSDSENSMHSTQSMQSTLLKLVNHPMHSIDSMTQCSKRTNCTRRTQEWPVSSTQRFNLSPTRQEKMARVWKAPTDVVCQRFHHIRARKLWHYLSRCQDGALLAQQSRVVATLAQLGLFICLYPMLDPSLKVRTGYMIAGARKSECTMQWQHTSVMSLGYVSVSGCFSRYHTA
jgi:hypothetical protein